MEAADLQVFADGHDLLGQDLGDLQIGARVLAFLDCLDVGGVVLQDDLADILDELNERSGLRAEVGLAVDLDDSADAALFADGSVCHTLGSDAVCLLGSLRQTLFAQPLDCLIHIAVGLGERLLAVHHTDVGHFTQFLDISSSKCHCYFLLIEIVSFDSEKAPVARRALFDCAIIPRRERQPRLREPRCSLRPDDLRQPRLPW